MANLLNKAIENTDLRIIEVQGENYVTNFDSWEQLNQFCERINKHYDCRWSSDVAEPVILYHRDGQDWKCTHNTAYEPFLTDINDICESLNAVNAFPKKDNLTNEKLLEEEYYPLIEGLDDDDDANEINEIKERVDIYCQQLEGLKENQVLVIFDGGGYDIADMNCLRYSYDVHNYMIVVKLEFIEDKIDDIDYLDTCISLHPNIDIDYVCEKNNWTRHHDGVNIADDGEWCAYYDGNKVKTKYIGE